MKKSIVFLIALFVIISSPIAYGDFMDDLEFELHNSARWVINDGDDNKFNEENITTSSYTYSRLNLVYTPELLIFKVPVYLLAYGETRYDLDEDYWYRTEAGVGAGAQLFKLFRFQTELNYAWVQPGSDDSWEAQGGLYFNLPFPDFLPFLDLSLYALDEYTYNIDEGKGTINEVAAGFNLAPFELVNFQIGWRHTDYIHGSDSDMVEVGATIKF